MIDYVCYLEDGNIALWGNCQPENLPLLAMEGATVLEGWGTERTHCVLGEAITPYTDEQRTRKAVRPPYLCRWDNALMAWIDLRSLAEVKAQKNDEIDAARVRANQSTFTHASKTIAFDAVSQKDIELTNGEINNTGAMPLIWPGGWKAMDKSFVPIATVAEWRAFYSSIYAQGGSNFAHSQQLKAVLLAATTIEEVNAVVW